MTNPKKETLGTRSIKKGKKIKQFIVQKNSSFVHLITRHIKRRRNTDRISLGELVYATGNKSFSLLIAIFSFPMILPIPYPPGFSIFSSIPCMFISFQLALGMKKIYLPHFISRHTISKDFFSTILNKFDALLKKVQFLFKKRLGFFLTEPFIYVVGILCFCMSIELFLPVPFTNIPIALSIFLMSLGLFISDGLLVLIGIVLSALSTIFVASILLIGKALVSKLAYFLGWIG